MKKLLKANIYFSFLGLTFGTFFLGLQTNSSDNGVAGLYLAIYFIPILLVVGYNILLIGLCNVYETKALRIIGLLICPLTLLVIAIFSVDFKLYILWTLLITLINLFLVWYFKDIFFEK